MGTKTAAQAVDEMVALLNEPPLVTMDKAGVVTFTADGGAGWDYEFSPTDAGDCLRWIEHMGQKTWVTSRHLEQFARLAADHFGARYR